LSRGDALAETQTGEVTGVESDHRAVGQMREQLVEYALVPHRHGADHEQLAARAGLGGIGRDRPGGKATGHLARAVDPAGIAERLEFFGEVRQFVEHDLVPERTEMRGHRRPALAATGDGDAKIAHAFLPSAAPRRH